MEKTLLSLPVNAVVWYLSSLFLPSVQITDFKGLLLALLTLTLVNALVRPLVMLAALPLNLFTLGLPVVVINAWMIMLADWFVPALTISGFWTAVMIALLLIVTESIAGNCFLKAQKI